MIDIKEFVIAALDADSKTFIVYIAIREQKQILVHLKKKTQIKVQVEALIFDEAPTIILVEYSNYNNVFSAENVEKLLEHIEMNNYAIKLEENKQPLFGSIYSLGSVE